MDAGTRHEVRRRILAIGFHIHDGLCTSAQKAKAEYEEQMLLQG
jgi:hypothetical protein